MSRRMRIGLCVLAVVYAVLGHRYAFVWQSDLTLWTYAHRMAPHKERPAMNYMKAAWGR